MAMTTGNPKWWTDQHASVWDKVKGALERDWEQTKNDLSKSNGHELRQNATDTVKQAMGSEPIPESGGPNPPPLPGASDSPRASKVRDENVRSQSGSGRGPGGADSDWSGQDSGVRYGYSVRSQYPSGSEWNAALEGKLQAEWAAINPWQPWEAVRGEIHRGWDYAGKQQ